MKRIYLPPNPNEPPTRRSYSREGVGVKVLKIHTKRVRLVEGVFFFFLAKERTPQMWTVGCKSFAERVGGWGVVPPRVRRLLNLPPRIPTWVGQGKGGNTEKVFRDGTVKGPTEHEGRPLVRRNAPRLNRVVRKTKAGNENRREDMRTKTHKCRKQTGKQY